jgi:LAO/AO transport system kinase
VHPIAQRVLQREIRGVARACRLVDDRVDGYLDLLKDLFPHTGKAWIVGVTGNPGAGKSTVTDRLVSYWRSEGKRVGVIAVDPTSPFSGGAILGDRIRMQRHFEDPDVFIRSLATRGALGGLSRSAIDVMRVLDAWGADVVVVETVGVGQDEMEVTRSAHSTLIVVAPGLGDDIQAAKAGILECGDVFAVNKADREGADAAVRDLELMVALGRRVVVAPQPSLVAGHAGSAMRRESAGVDGDGSWIPPIVRCIATQNQGLEEVVGWLARHRAWVMDTSEGQARWHARLREQMENEMRNALVDAALRDIGDQLERAVASVSRRELDPYTACERLVSAFRKA